MADIIRETGNITASDTTVDAATTYDEITTDMAIADTAEEVPSTDTDKEKYKILRHAYMKLDGLPLSFNLPRYDEDIPDKVVDKYFGIDLADTIRETHIKIENIEPDSIDEMQFENRIVYHALKRFRLTASVFFKFSTAVDGKTVDKTQIPKMLSNLITEYEEEYKKWRLGHVGKLWNRGGS